ncbi:hypothetical protein LAG90_05800 [Marinilongibacter aquaticus]|uniref:hypothetical protein n=1 Tax=Marinilongibacter aquaticus TaxID=2975157 RepID=UPI0021BDE437|nr:hypothetical protein [Marinilongibacter aquaticus]UBM60154.1 hypothetical protein LAG90_05800 [Marinilongibacter aquaticus]
MTLFQKFDEVLTEERIENLKKLGERNLGDTKGGIHAIFYTLVAGLIRRANSDMSTGMLVRQIEKLNTKHFESKTFDELLKSEKDLESFVQTGEKTLSQIFPSFRSQLISLIVSNYGTGKSETTVYTGFVNSFLIHFLGEKLNSEELEKEDLMNFLREHRDPLFENAPASLVDKMIPAMGMHELKDMKMTFAKRAEEKKSREEEYEAVEETVQAEASEYYEEEGSNNWVKPTLIVLAVAALGALGYFAYINKEAWFGVKQSKETAIVDEALMEEPLVDTTMTAAIEEPTVDPAITALKGLLAAADLKNGDEFRAESLSFANGATDLANENNPLIDSLIEQFNSNPRFQIQIKGGDANGSSQTALKRAFDLKRLLQNKGVDPIRIDAIADSEKIDYLKIKIVSK